MPGLVEVSRFLGERVRVRADVRRSLVRGGTAASGDECRRDQRARNRYACPSKPCLDLHGPLLFVLTRTFRVHDDDTSPRLRLAP